MTIHSYNKGEWSEVYIFFKVMSERKLYAADANFKPLKNVYLDILSVIREEVEGHVYKYNTGDIIKILHNNDVIGEISVEEFIKSKNTLWGLLQQNKETTFASEEIEKFLNSIFIFKPKSPANIVSEFSGGTVDIVIETQDQGGINRILGFSCKSDLTSSSTLLNASADNTNFIFEVVGDIDDDKMSQFNNIFTQTTRRGEIRHNIATSERMNFLKSNSCDIKFVKPARELARENLIRCGGIEMPSIVGGMLKKYYFENSSNRTSMEDCINYLSETDFVNYGFSNLYSTYRGKIANLLLSSFTGMRLGSPWDGRQAVNGGYIVVKNDGDVVAFHSTITDEFKDFLISKIYMESPSHSRHKDMVIYKEDGRYFLKLALQLRFTLSR